MKMYWFPLAEIRDMLGNKTIVTATFGNEPMSSRLSGTTQAVELGFE